MRTPRTAKKFGEGSSAPPSSFSLPTTVEDEIALQVWRRSGSGSSVSSGSPGSPSSSSMSNPMTTLGDMIYGDTGGVPAAVAGNIEARRKHLQQEGDGAASSAPEWEFISRNIVTVEKAGGDFQTINDAIAWIAAEADAAADNPYLIRVGPGLWEESVSLPEYVSMQGAGRGITVIDPHDFDQVIRVQANSEVCDLTSAVANFNTFALYSQTINNVAFRRIDIVGSQFSTDDSGYVAIFADFDIFGEASLFVEDIHVDDSVIGRSTFTEFIISGGGAGFVSVCDGYAYVRNVRTIGDFIAHSVANITIDTCSGPDSSAQVVFNISEIPGDFVNAVLRNCRFGELQIGDSAAYPLSVDTIVNVHACQFDTIDVQIGSFDGDYTGLTDSGIRTSSFVEVPEVAAPSTPPSGYIRMYGKSDGDLYQLDSSGIETNLTKPSMDDILTLSDGSIVVLASTGNVVTL